MSLDLTTIAPSPPAQLGDIELLALALDRSTSAAALLMNHFGGVHGLARASHHDLVAARVPPRRAQQLHVAR
jgi:DNA repair protein RadC